MTDLNYKITPTATCKEIADYLGVPESVVEDAMRAGSTTYQHVYDYCKREREREAQEAQEARDAERARTGVNAVIAEHAARIQALQQEVAELSVQHSELQDRHARTLAKLRKAEDYVKHLTRDRRLYIASGFVNKHLTPAHIDAFDAVDQAHDHHGFMHTRLDYLDLCKAALRMADTLIDAAKEEEKTDGED